MSSILFGDTMVPNNGESNGKEHGKWNGNYVYIEVILGIFSRTGKCCYRMLQQSRRGSDASIRFRCVSGELLPSEHYICCLFRRGLLGVWFGSLASCLA